MELMIDILEVLDTSMEEPELYGWFHIMWLVITAAVTTALCTLFKNATGHQIRGLVLTVAIIVILAEIYKQINFTFRVTDGVLQADYQWYAFPFQFCSMPMYVGLLAGITKKGRVHNALCAFLATYAVFAGACVMFYPADVFTRAIGINIQTMLCHGSMIVVGIYLLYTGYVPCTHKTILRAMPLFAICVAIAAVLNEIAHASGLLAGETFNMFFINPYCAPSLPVYSLVQQVVAYPLNLVIYVLGFSLAAYLILLAAIMIKKVANRRSKKEALT